jgi:hypothetical protein
MNRENADEPTPSIARRCVDCSCCSLRQKRRRPHARQPLRWKPRPDSPVRTAEGQPCFWCDGSRSPSASHETMRSAPRRQALRGRHPLSATQPRLRGHRDHPRDHFAPP